MTNRIILTGSWVATELQLRTISARGKDVAAVQFRLKMPKKTDRGSYQYFTVRALGKTAEFICHYFQKGQAIELEGRLDAELYEDKEGRKQESVVIHVTSVDFGERQSAPQQPRQSQPEQTTGSALRLPPNFVPKAGSPAADGRSFEPAQYQWDEIPA